MTKDEAIDLLRDALEHYNRLAPNTITAREALRLTANLAPSSEPVDERYEFERYMSQQGEAVNYIGDGLYASGIVQDRWDTWMFRAELVAEAPPARSIDPGPRIPQTPEEAIAFIGSHFSAQLDAANPEDMRYELTVHDILSAFHWWFNIDPSAEATPAPVLAGPEDPMDWPLPCDVKVGAGTIRKGCKLRTLVLRMEGLHRMAMEALPKVTDEQRAQFNALFPAAPAAPLNTAAPGDPAQTGAAEPAVDIHPCIRFDASPTAEDVAPLVAQTIAFKEAP